MNNRSHTRLLRTEVIWSNDAEDDPDESCPVNCDLVGTNRKTILSAFLVLMIVAGQRIISSKLHNDSMTNITPLGWDDGSSAIQIMGEISVNSNSVGEQSIEWGLQHHKEVTLPKTLDENLADVDEPLRYEDVPYFFHTPRTMGQTTKQIVGNCIGLNTTNLTATIEGIYTAKKLDILNGGNVDIIVTQYLHAGATLFNEKHRGR